MAASCEGLLAGFGFEDAVAVLAEVLADDGADAGVVVAEDDGAVDGGETGGDGRGSATGLRRGQGKQEGGSGAAALLLVGFCPDAAVVLVDDGAADGEAEAGAAFLAGVGGFDLLETVEDGVELVDGDAAADVGDAQEEELVVGFDADAGRCRRTGENLMALERRLVRTWRIRSESPSK